MSESPAQNKNAERAHMLETEKISSLLMKFSIPAIVGMLVSALYNVIDRIFIGNSAGPLALTGITVAFPIMIIQMAFGGMIGIGAAALVSIRLGEKKKDDAERIMGNAIVLLGLVTLFVTALGLLFMDPMLRLFGADADSIPYARDYMTIIIAGSIFGAFSMGLNNLIRSEGKPGIAMMTMLVSAVVNAATAPVFIFVFGWGVKGAALATIVGQATSFTWIVLYFLTGRSMLKIRMQNLRIVPELTWRILSIGIAFFTMNIAQSVLTIILNKSLYKYGGNIAISGMGVVNSLVTLIVMPIIGINQGAQPITGYNFGAKRPDRVKENLKLAIIAASVICVVGYAVTRVFPVQMISLFNSDPELIAVGTQIMRVFLFCLPLVGFQIIGGGYFQAVGKAGKSMVLNLSRQVIILIPALLILPHFFGFAGVLYAGPVADLLSAGLTAFWLGQEMRRLGREHESISKAA